MENGPIDRDLTDIPRVMDNLFAINGAVRDRSLFVALDFDGTLAPINNDPDAVFLSPEMKKRLDDLSRVCMVAIVTGRDLRDIRHRVGLKNLFYSGSHGFEIVGPPESGIAFEAGKMFLPALEEAERRLGRTLGHIPGSVLQRKRFSISAHYRLVEEARVAEMKDLVEETVAGLGGLRTRSDKKAVEILPDKEWNKGSAVLWLLDFFKMTPWNSFAIYVGDDVTDEDGFRAVAGRGAGVIVTETEPPASTCALYRLESVIETGLLIEHLTRIS